MSTTTLMSIILLSPLVGFLLNGFRWKSSNYKLAGVVASGAAILSFFSSVLLFCKLLDLPVESREIREVFFSWISVGELTLNASFVLDQISGLMVLVVTGVGSLIHIFSIGYMSHDSRPTKYFAYLNLFLFNMLLLVLGSNLLVMFVGWEGVGLCSYLLIGFWFTDSEKAAAGMKAFIANRIGDAALLLGAFLLFIHFGTLEFSEILSKIPEGAEVGFGVMTAACLLLFVGATGKSAQIPLYVWLPDAMAGPTPVSALIHAATMVTAGVYMIVRLSGLFIYAPIAMCVIAVIGAATALMAASIGLAQNDIKKVLAYSTVSQLGYMFLACGVGAFNAAMFHLMTHAFFKALMFLGSGSVIHAMHEEQDIQKMGGLKKYLPITHGTFVIGWLAIIGTPLFSGFFSKDEILYFAWQSPRSHFILWLVAVITAGLTAFYMTRLMSLTFWGKSRVSPDVHPHESGPTMTIPLIVLAVLSLVGGWIGIPHVIGHALHIPNIFEHWLQPKLAPIPGFQQASAAMEILLMAISVSIAATSAFLAYVIYVKDPAKSQELANRFKSAYRVLANKYYVDEFYFAKIINPIVETAKGLWFYVDVNFIDKATYVISDLTKEAGEGVRSLQNGNMQQYAMYIVLGVAGVLVWIFMI